MQLLCLAEKWYHILHFKYLLMRWFITKIKRLEYGSTTSSLCWCRDSKNVLPGERVLCWLMLTDNTTLIKCWQQYFYNYMFANMQSHLTAWSANCYENRARITTFHRSDSSDCNWRGRDRVPTDNTQTDGLPTRIQPPTLSHAHYFPTHFSHFWYPSLARFARSAWIVIQHKYEVLNTIFCVFSCK